MVVAEQYKMFTLLTMPPQLTLFTLGLWFWSKKAIMPMPIHKIWLHRFLDF